MYLQQPMGSPPPAGDVPIVPPGILSWWDLQSKISTTFAQWAVFSGAILSLLYFLWKKNKEQDLPCWVLAAIKRLGTFWDGVCTCTKTLLPCIKTPPRASANPAEDPSAHELREMPRPFGGQPWGAAVAR
ncbi:hypothetical protein PGQ11_008094 [Apiospora arundinis]|uniref:Uncharacterized protein n=1 Tax=Apiospora arundinis TaxID=335852 RepID=A0ABR2IEF7_9PEZI